MIVVSNTPVKFTYKSLNLKLNGDSAPCPARAEGQVFIRQVQDPLEPVSKDEMLNRQGVVPAVLFVYLDPSQSTLKYSYRPWIMIFMYVFQRKVQMIPSLLKGVGQVLWETPLKWRKYWVKLVVQQEGLFFKTFYQYQMLNFSSKFALSQ